MAVMNGFFDGDGTPLTAQTLMAAFEPFGNGVCGPGDLEVTLAENSESYTIAPGLARINGGISKRTESVEIPISEVGTEKNPQYICLRFRNTADGKDITPVITSAPVHTSTLCDLPLASYVGKSGSITLWRDERKVLPQVEYGTWTPEFMSTKGDTQTTSNGKYVKIGDVVYLFFTLSGFPSEGSDYPVKIKGIPYKAGVLNLDDQTTAFQTALPNAAGSVTATGMFGFSNLINAQNLSAGSFAVSVSPEDNQMSLMLNRMCDYVAGAKTFVAQNVRVYVQENTIFATRITGLCAYYTNGEEN